MTAYIGLLRKEAKSDYGVDFPDFPGCISAGRTLDEARRFAVEALHAHVDLMAEDGDILPEPSSLEDIMANQDNKDAVAFLVEIDSPYATRRINVTIREDALWKIDQYAKGHGLTRSDFLARAALKEISKDAALTK